MVRSMELFRLELAAAVLLMAAATATAQRGDIDPCNTPRQSAGNCINIKLCPELLALLTNQRLTPEDSAYLRASQCGFEGADPKVCCPLEQSVSEDLRPEPPTTTSTQRTTRPTSRSTTQQTTRQTTTRQTTRSPLLNRHIDTSLLPSETECGLSTANRILGGEVAELDEFPWMALLEYQKPNGRGFYCGGVLINNRYILTAAHCVKGKDIPKTWKLVSVRLGEYNTETELDCIADGVGSEDCADPPINVAIEDQIVHEEYMPRDRNQYHDIALLRLRKSVSFTDFIKPICLPHTNEQLGNDYTEDQLYVAGWGKTENRSESPIKLKLKVPVVQLGQCSTVYKSASVNLQKSQLCAGGLQGKDSCRGDSGGPLMSVKTVKGQSPNWYAAGIVSFGPSPCGMKGWPGIYTRVSDYMEWITMHLKQ